MGTKKIKKLIDDLKTKKIDMCGRDFLLTWEHSSDELEATFLVADALRALTDALAAQTRDVDVEYSLSATAALLVPLETSNHLYRIAQEAVNNALKHGAPSLVRVALNVDVERVRVEVSDDGSGIACAAATDDGLGLRSMHDRAAAISAVLTVAPSDLGGTMIRCECPNVDPEGHRR